MKKCKIDNLGRIVIPIQYRKELGLKANSEIRLEFDGDRLVISPSEFFCCICRELISDDSKLPLCAKCVNIIKNTEQE